MTKSLTATREVVPLSLKDSPSLIERLLPVQKISAEAQKERKAGNGQTLTALGNYWKGRKPLILNKACILGLLLPVTENSQADLDVFEKLMAIHDESFEHRAKTSQAASKLGEISYLERMSPSMTYRPEEIPDETLYGAIWNQVNDHLGTDAHSMAELVEQLGLMRFGRRPKIADTFAGSGQIAFEAARLGCDVFASDLNPIACLLTWAAFNIVGANPEMRSRVEAAQKSFAKDVEQEVDALRIEYDSDGNRAKAFLYCLEARCPHTGWTVPMLATRVIGKTDNIVARLVPDKDNKRFVIEVVPNASSDEVAAAKDGTIQDDCLVYTLEGEEYRTPIRTLRGDYKSGGETLNQLRPWDKSDFMSQPSDLFVERLYAIQWQSADSLQQSRPKTFFSSVRDEDVERERVVESIVRKNFAHWQNVGIIPDMPIEPGDETTRLRRERGWTYWHHLFSPRHLLLLSIFKKHLSKRIGIDAAACLVYFCAVLNSASKLCRLDPSGGNVGRAPKIIRVFDNQAVNPLYNWAERALAHLYSLESDYKRFAIRDQVSVAVECSPASVSAPDADYFITDPPYADAVQYHEITEFFISWLRRNLPDLFSRWIWDSRRALAIKGSGDDFRAQMIASYKAMADNMPDNGRQVIMFTHQDAAIWADMACIVWGAGLQVTAAWYIATETTSELKKGGYVQGTVLLVLRKRAAAASAYRDELVQELKSEVVHQLDTLLGLNQAAKGQGRTENLFEDADLQMAGYAAALRVLTAYTHIDGKDMSSEALRPRIKGQKGVVSEIIDFAVQVANEHLVPEGLSAGTWDALNGAERFYLKMIDIESVGLKKLDNYQNFAKAFRVSDYTSLMASCKANDSRLKCGLDLKKSLFEGEFGQSRLRALLFAMYELQKEVDSDEVMAHLRDMIAGYHNQRDTLMALTSYIAAKRTKTNEKEAEAARILLACIQNERLGG